MTSVPSTSTNLRRNELVTQIFAKINRPNGCFLHDLMTLNTQQEHSQMRVVEMSKKTGGTLVCGLYDKELWDILLHLFNENQIGVNMIIAEPALIFGFYSTSDVMFDAYPLITTRKQMMSNKTYFTLLSLHTGRKTGDGAFVWVDKAAETYSFHWDPQPSV